MYSGFITDFSKIFEDLPDSISSIIKISYLHASLRTLPLLLLTFLPIL